MDYKRMNNKLPHHQHDSNSHVFKLQRLLHTAYFMYGISSDVRLSALSRKFFAAADSSW